MTRDEEELITARDHNPGALRHIVLLRYQEDLSQLQRTAVRQRFSALAESLRDGQRYITSLEWGPQISPEGLSGGFDDAFILTFSSEGDRNYYLGAPLISSKDLRDENHHQFKEFLGPYLASQGPAVLVFDFAVQH